LLARLLASLHVQNVKTFTTPPFSSITFRPQDYPILPPGSYRRSSHFATVTMKLLLPSANTPSTILPQPPSSRVHPTLKATVLATALQPPLHTLTTTPLKMSLATATSFVWSLPILTAMGSPAPCCRVTIQLRWAPLPLHRQPSSSIAKHRKPPQPPSTSYRMSLALYIAPCSNQIPRMPPSTTFKPHHLNPMPTAASRASSSNHNII